MPPRDLRAYLFDIEEACRLVDEFTRGKSAADVEASLPVLRERVGALLKELNGQGG